jgi:hypothetical protein
MRAFLLLRANVNSPAPGTTATVGFALRIGGEPGSRCAS